MAERQTITLYCDGCGASLGSAPANPEGNNFRPSASEYDKLLRDHNSVKLTYHKEGEYYTDSIEVRHTCKDCAKMLADFFTEWKKLK